jgi:hypothetical protein
MQQTITCDGISETVVNMNGLAPGIYYIRYVDENRQVVTKQVQKL